VQRCLLQPRRLVAELQESQRVTTGLAMQAIGERPVELALGQARRPSTEQLRRRLAVETIEPQSGQVGTVEKRRLALPHRE
jgi:hypothetical protein